MVRDFLLLPNHYFFSENGKALAFVWKGRFFWLLNLWDIIRIPFLIAHAAAAGHFYAPRFIPLVCCCCSLEVRLWQGKLFWWRGERLAREGLSSFALEEGALSHLSQKERTFRCLLPETDLLSILFRRRIKMFATRHPLLPLLSSPTPCCGNGPGCVVFSPAFLGLLFGLMVLEMLCRQLRRLCFILSCCLWFISVSRTALQFDPV